MKDRLPITPYSFIVRLQQQSWWYTLGGALLWGVAWWKALPFLPLMVLLAGLVLIPIALPLTLIYYRQQHPSVITQGTVVLWPVAAIALFISFLFDPGPKAGLWACGWTLYTFGLGLAGLNRLRHHGLQALEEVAIAAALLMLPVGGIWFMFSRLGWPLLGFNEPWVLLTAMHFHYAGFVLPLVCGITGRWLTQYRGIATWYRIVTCGILSGVPLLALGIATFSILEVMAALVLTASTTGLALLWVRYLFLAIPFWSGGFLLGIASMSVVNGMLFVVAYALGEWLGLAWISIPAMLHTHGVLNAIGFALPAMLFCRLLKAPVRFPVPGIPFSRLKGGWWIGPDFFPPLQSPPVKLPTGLIDDMGDYRRPDFDPARLSPAIRHFYEHTQDYQLYVQPLWQPGFRWLGKRYRRMAETWGQMVLPVTTERRYDEIDSRIIPVDSQADGRSNVRAWIRTYSATQQPVYVAAYACHSAWEQIYMNIAFPLPGGHLTSVLRLNPLPVPGTEEQALQLTSLPIPHFGDQGVYGVSGRLSVRLPINETITVWVKGTPGFPDLNPPEDLAEAPLLASHDMWVFGLYFLRLHYYIFAISS